MLEDCWAKLCDWEDSKSEDEDIGGWASCDSVRTGSGRDSTANPEKNYNFRLIENDMNIKNSLSSFLNLLEYIKQR